MINTRKIKARLVELGLTQKDVATALGIAQATASQKINMVRPLYIDEAKELAKLLQLETDAFEDYFFK